MPRRSILLLRVMARPRQYLFHVSFEMFIKAAQVLSLMPASLFLLLPARSFVTWAARIWGEPYRHFRSPLIAVLLFQRGASIISFAAPARPGPRLSWRTHNCGPPWAIPHLSNRSGFGLAAQEYAAPAHDDKISSSVMKIGRHA